MKLLVVSLLPLLVIGAAAAMMSLANGFARAATDPKTVEISVIDEGRARELFKEFASDKTIPFKYQSDGCYARATEMAQLAEKENVVMGRV